MYQKFMDCIEQIKTLKTTLHVGLKFKDHIK